MPHSPNHKGRAKPPTPLSSFDPRFRDLLLDGAKAVIELPCNSRGEATRLRQRLNQYRFACKKHFGEADPHEWEPLYRCIVQQRAATLILRPRDSEFDSVLSRVGMTAPAVQLPSDFLTNLLAEKETEQ